MYKTIAFVSALFAGAEAGFSWGQCPDFTVQQDFDVESYSGRWYEVAKDRYIPFEIGSKCVQAKYEATEDGPVAVTNYAYIWAYGWFSMGGFAYELDPIQAEGSLFVTFNDEKPTEDTQGNYNVISTDYDSYTIVYSCSQHTWWNYSYLWLLTREP